MPPFDDLTADRICVIKPSALGDVVQTLPILGPLRRRFPNARIAWVINRGLADLIDGHAHIDEVLPFERRGGLRAQLDLLRTLRRRRFDLVLDLQGLARSGVMTWASGAAVRLGMQTGREGSQLACTAIVPGTGRDVPARQRYRQIAEALGTAGDDTANLPLCASDRDWAAAALAHLPRPWLAVAPGAKWVTKRWPPEKFAALAAQAHRRYGVSAVIVGGADETALGTAVETELQRQMSAAAVRNLTGQTSLRRLAAVLAACDWAATNDSGPMHLADAVGTPVLGLFTCTSPWLSGPAPERHELVATRLGCAAGYHKQCPHSGAGHQACLAELDVARATAAFARLVSRTARRAA